MSMTAKRKPRGTLARLEALEDAHAARVQAVEDLKGEQTRAALALLDAATLADLHAHHALSEAGGPGWAAFCETAGRLRDVYPDSVNPVRPGAVAWCDSTEDLPDGVPFPTCPPAFVAYFEEEGRACDRALSDLGDGAGLPDGVTVEEARQVLRYARAGWLLWAAQGRVLGGGAA